MKGSPLAEAGSETYSLLASVSLHWIDRTVELSALRQTTEWVPRFLHGGQEQVFPKGERSHRWGLDKR